MKSKSKGLAPTKGQAPITTGVPGELVPMDGLELVFATRKARISPYDEMLDKLAAAGPGQALRFDDPRARASVTYRAKKKEFLISFAEHEGGLYVRFDGRVLQDPKTSRRAAILNAIDHHPTAVQLAVRLRQEGDVNCDASIVAAILTQMVRAGELTQQAGGSYVRVKTKK